MGNPVNEYNRSSPYKSGNSNFEPPKKASNARLYKVLNFTRQLGFTKVSNFFEDKLTSKATAPKTKDGFKINLTTQDTKGNKIKTKVSNFFKDIFNKKPTETKTADTFNPVWVKEVSNRTRPDAYPIWKYEVNSNRTKEETTGQARLTQNIPIKSTPESLKQKPITEEISHPSELKGKFKIDVPDDNQIEIIFKGLTSEVVNYNHPSCTVAGEHLEKNRYADILPFDDYLYPPKASVNGSVLYLNASEIKVGELHYVATQGPTETTIKDFWKAVISGKSNKVINLTNEIEKNRIKCHDYWSHETPLEIEGFGVVRRLEGEERIPADNGKEVIVKRQFEFQSPNGQEKQIIEHFHYENWPDFGTADVKLFNKLQEVVDETSTSGPLIVHCSAGVGRTGTFITAHSLALEIKKNNEEKQEKIDIDVPGRVNEIRKFRAGLVQTQEQLHMVYKSLEERFK